MANIMIVLDGLEDMCYKELGGKNPYDFGKGKIFLKVEAHSSTGRLATTPQGFEPDTQTCVLTLLGVQPRDIPGGRSYIEALALGIPVDAQDIVLRANFVKIDDKGRLELPTCACPPEVAAQLLEEVAAQENCEITQVGSYKSLLRVKGAAKYLDAMQTHLPHQHGGADFKEVLPSGNELAEYLAFRSLELLEKYRPYTVMNWAQSVKGDLPLFADLHHGLSGAMVSKTHSPMGVAVAMGMDCPDLPTCTGDTDTDLRAKVRCTLELAAKRDFVMLHVGGPDEATHRKDAVEKAEFIRKLDAELLSPILAALRDGDRVMVTCDHMALCSTGGHTDQPVQYWLYEEGKSRSGADAGTLPGTGAVELLCRRDQEPVS